MNAAGATTITVNTGLFAAGDTVFIQNLGAGACTVTAGTATVATAGSLILPQNDAGILYFTATGAAIFYDYIQAGAVSPLTTKGDLYTFSTSDARLGVGANDTVLTADSSTATGLKWASAASPAANNQIILQQSGNYIRTPHTTAAASSSSVTEDRTYYQPIYLSGISFDRISIYATNNFSGSGVVRLGIYNHDNATGKPSTVYLDAGTVAPAFANSTYEITISTTPPAGYYWLAFNMQTLASTSEFYRIAATANAIACQNSDSPGSDGGTKFSYWHENGITGAFATAGTLSLATQAFVVSLRMA